MTSTAATLPAAWEVTGAIIEELAAEGWFPCLEGPLKEGDTWRMSFAKEESYSADESTPHKAVQAAMLLVREFEHEDD